MRAPGPAVLLTAPGRRTDLSLFFALRENPSEVFSFVHKNLNTYQKKKILTHKHYHNQIPDYLYRKRKQVLLITAENMVLVTVVKMVVMVVINKEERQEYHCLI